MLTILLGMMAMVGQEVQAAEKSFNDVDRSHWAYDTIEWAVENQIVNGYADGTFKPGNPVSEPEFLAMLFRAYSEIDLPQAGPGEGWYSPYFSLASSYNWTVWHETDGTHFNRGRVAQVLAASQGQRLLTNPAVQYLLDHQIANGKTSATVEGFGIEDKLTRAEAVKLIENVKLKGLSLHKAVETSGVEIHEMPNGFHVRGIQIGDTEADVIAKLGEPARKDASEYGFQWYIYNEDYMRYAQVGIQQDRVVGLYTNGSEWSSSEGITLGKSLKSVRTEYGEPLAFILKGNTRFFFIEGSDKTEPTYLLDGSYVTFFIDQHDQDKVTAVQLIEQTTEVAMQSFYGQPSDELRSSFELQLLDLANAIRARFDKKELAWNGSVANLARDHSRDMADQQYFSHTNKEGLTPFDRLEAAGLDYRYASENISAGQSSAIFAHEGWMNSQGHRDNILSEKPTQLGVGAHMGGSMDIYYTQNFFTPMQ